ncbi:MAG TPA: 16S rRNA (uracil(1498)-N(3))-methyltransferase [Motilibacteraceae bacterium]|nr:16S rRNA (uracil(1498)-N(3))-methyltransferase [Motilibacteraceae bacterium]
MTAPVFLVPAGRLAGVDVGARVLLDGPEGRHAVAVRRLAVGERVDLADGEGSVVEGTVAEVVGRDALAVDVLALRHEPEPPLRLVVVQALPKGDRGELAVETMTEVGVDVVVPWQASRSVTQWRGDRGARALERWRSTAREAAKQARRARVPQVPEAAATKDVVARIAATVAAGGLAAVLHEEAVAPLASVPLPAAGDVVLVVGPEGGVSPEELEAFTAAGAVPLRLGPTVLRTSTAGVAALSVLSAHAGRWG